LTTSTPRTTHPSTAALAARARFASAIPARYSPARGLLFNTAFGVTGAACSLASIGGAGNDIRPAEWLAFPAALLAMNLLEYLSHRYLMHRRTRVLPYAYYAHTVRHHASFSRRHMPIASPRELWLIIFSPLDVALFAACAVPLLALLAWVAPRNVAALAAAAAFCHYLAYEWLHLLSHLPDGHWLARSQLFAGSRRRHALHHGAPGANLNITLPISDWLFGTLLREPAAARGRPQVIPPGN
jgi:hypothetical protein